MLKFSGVAVGGIKVKAMTPIKSYLLLMLTVSHGKLPEHFIEKINIINLL